jgi:hypothetical protein
MRADGLDYVLGVDTHRDAHALAVVSAAVGAVELETQIASSGAGYRDALRLAERHASGRRVWAIEGTGSWGAGLCRFLQAEGERVLEVDRLRREYEQLRAQTTPSHTRSAVGDDDVEASVRERQPFCLALDELHVPDGELARAHPCFGDHLGRHVDAGDASFHADHLGGAERVGA